MDLFGPQFLTCVLSVSFYVNSPGKICIRAGVTAGFIAGLCRHGFQMAASPKTSGLPQEKADTL